jgi:formylglycine-generating enzyme required for sulfatase activity
MKRIADCLVALLFRRHTSAVKVTAKSGKDAFSEQNAAGEKIAIDDLKMVSIPGGTFSMGSTTGEKDQQPVHKVALSAFEITAYELQPAHTVTLSAFEMSAYEVTVGQFRGFVNETGYRTEAERGDGAYVLVKEGWTKKAAVVKKADANWK